jgi:hypothetical protein
LRNYPIFPAHFEIVTTQHTVLREQKTDKDSSSWVVKNGEATCEPILFDF